MAVLGGTIGSVLAGSITEKFGRKLSILFSDLLLIVGPVLLIITSELWLWALWRGVIGFGMGLNMMCSQVFMSESSPNELRGQIQSLYILGCFSGFIFSHLSSLTFSYRLSLMFGLGIVPVAAQAILMILTQNESPTYVAAKTKNVILVSKILGKFYNTNSAEGL